MFTYWGLSKEKQTESRDKWITEDYERFSLIIAKVLSHFLETGRLTLL